MIVYDLEEVNTLPSNHIDQVDNFTVLWVDQIIGAANTEYS